MLWSHAGDTAAGSRNLLIVTANDLAAWLAYYTSPRMAATFHEARPIAGAVTHWDYAGASRSAPTSASAT